MSAFEIAFRTLLWWLLLPAVGLPVAVWAQRRGRGRFLSRLLVWLAVVPLFVGGACLGSAALAGLLAVAAIFAAFEIVRLPAPMGESERPATALKPALAASVILGLSAWIVMARLPEGPAYVVTAFSAVAVADILSYASGRLIPSPRVLPRLSPGKTLAGYVGGVAGALLAAMLLRFALPGRPLAWTVGAGLVLAVAGAAGDLVGSAVKRRHGVKDFGRTLGPHGGMLDRLDSLLAAGWIFIAWLALTGEL